MKIVTIVGARPQFIKAAVLSAAFAKLQDLQEIIVHTGQHYDANMSDIFFDEMDIPKPTYNLDIGGGTHGKNTGRMIESIESVLFKEQPDLVLVYGDTDSTLAGALAACKMHIPVAHVEAGLRSYNRKMPEEINRVLTDQVSDILFTPSDEGKKNLLQEGIAESKINIVGDVMYDATLKFKDIAAKHSNIIEKYSLHGKQYILATIHRAENTNDTKRLSEIIEGLGSSDKLVILPLHPRTRIVMEKNGFNFPDNVTSIEPVGYLDMQALESNAVLIATDSGGVQKEAYFHGVPCITLRDETEWIELVSLGANTLTGADSTKIKEAIQRSIGQTIQRTDIYGTGTAAQEIAAVIQAYLADVRVK